MGVKSSELPVSRSEYGLMSTDQKVQVAFLGYESLRTQVNVVDLDDSQLAEHIAEASGCDFEAAMLVTFGIRYPNDM